MATTSPPWCPTLWSRLRHSCIPTFQHSGIACLLLFLTACGSAPQTDTNGKKPKELIFPVESEIVAVRTITPLITAPGSIEANETVSVTARVAGVADKVAFAIGDAVTEGQVLVEIEPERFRLAVEQAKAGVTKADAAKADADIALKRREDANRINPGLVRDEDIQTARTRVLSAAADQAQARTAVAKAELDLRDALVRAPLTGVVQSRPMQTGQYIQTGTVLTTLLRRDPLHAVFQVSESDAARIALGNTVSFTVNTSLKSFPATIDYLAAAADTTSRMVLVRALVTADDARALRPGAFAQITVPVAGEAHPVIPLTAVRPSERGFLAFIIDASDPNLPIARERKLTLGLRDSSGRVEVRDGLIAGERLVIRGSEALRDGVRVSMAAEPAAK